MNLCLWMDTTRDTGIFASFSHVHALSLSLNYVLPSAMMFSLLSEMENFLSLATCIMCTSSSCTFVQACHPHSKLSELIPMFAFFFSKRVAPLVAIVLKQLQVIIYRLRIVPVWLFTTCSPRHQCILHTCSDETTEHGHGAAFPERYFAQWGRSVR